MEVVDLVGLEVEMTKTSVAEEFGSLNSTLFRWQDEFLVPVATVRMGMLRSPDFVVGIGSSFASFVKGLPSKLRFRAALCWFSYNISKIRSSRLTLPELGFSGHLAWRMEKKFGLLSKLLPVVPPRPPVGHNLMLSSDNFSLVPSGALGPEERRINSWEMVAWKWGVDFSASRSRSVIRHFVALSFLRPVGPDFHTPFLRYRLTLPTFSSRAWIRRFFPVSTLEKEEICSHSLLFSQFWTPDFLPRYEEHEPLRVDVAVVA
jgi:hypothetical protein